MQPLSSDEVADLDQGHDQPLEEEHQVQEGHERGSEHSLGGVGGHLRKAQQSGSQLCPSFREGCTPQGQWRPESRDLCVGGSHLQQLSSSSADLADSCHNLMLIQ